MNEDDEFDSAGWAEQQLQERHRREDEALEHAHISTEELKRATVEYEQFMNESRRRCETWQANRYPF